jgi:hypothetical protein
MNKNKVTISAVINTKNANQLAPHHLFNATLNSLKFADQIVIVDMQSTDNTIKIAKQFTDDIYLFDDVGFVEPARNFAISKAKSDWVLIVDADEEIPASLSKKIIDLINGDATADAYKIPRKNMVFGSWYHFAGWWPDYQLRLFKQGKVKWSSKIHSVPQVLGNTDSLTDKEEFAILHHNYQSVAQFIERLNRYTTHEAKGRTRNNQIGPAQVVNAFEAELMSRLFKHRGISGGMHGVSLSFLQSFYELVVILKQWEQDGFPERNQRSSTIKAMTQLSNNIKYWLDDYEISKSNGMKKTILKVKRKLGI